jgi:hypothetical protein
MKRSRYVAGVALLAGVTACSGSHPVTLDTKTQQCVRTSNHHVVARGRCQSSPPPDDPFAWIWLFGMSNGTTQSVPLPVYNTTPIGTKYDDEKDEPGDEVDENGNKITTDDNEDGDEDNQDGSGGDDDNGGGSDGDDDGGGGGGDDGGGDD